MIRFRQTEAARSRERFQLTVAIPTFNRHRQLAQLLDGLAAECAGRSDRVLVAISNNASTDATDSVINQFCSANSDLAVDYWVQSSNIGPIPNIHFLVESGRSEFIWCVGDDDLPTPGTIERLLAILCEPQTGDLLLGRASGVQEWDTIRSRDGLLEIHDSDSEFGRYLMASGFLASIVFRTQRWRELIPLAEAFRAPNYSNWAAVLLEIHDRQRFLLLDEPVIAGNATMEGSPRFPLFHVLIEQRLRIWRELPQGPVRDAMAPFILTLVRNGWRQATMGSMPDLKAGLESVRMAAETFRSLGSRAISILPDAIFCSLLPPSARTKITSALLRFRRAAV